MWTPDIFEPLKLRKVIECIEPKHLNPIDAEEDMTKASHFLPTVLFPFNHFEM